MRQVQQRAAEDERGRPSGSSRRAFLGVGVGCAVPVLLGSALGGARSLSSAVRDRSRADPVWGHLAAEAARTWREVRGPHGVRGEHVRRLASQIDLFAVHLQELGDDRRVDEEVRALVEARGREGAAVEIFAHYRGLADSSGSDAPSLGASAPDIARLATCFEDLVSQGSARGLRARRAALEGLASHLDRLAAPGAVTVVKAAARQKPGDDFLGYPEVPPTGNACDMLQFLVLTFMVLSVFLPVFGLVEAAVPAQIMGALCEVVQTVYC